MQRRRSHRTIGWEGIRIFDVTDPRNPRFVKAVATGCGSHTDTVVPDPDHRRVVVYVSSYPLTGHGTDDDEEGPTTCGPAHYKISVIEVSLESPERARVVSQPSVAPAIGCQDIGVFTAIGKAAAACLTEGRIWDITDPANPGGRRPHLQPGGEHLALGRLRLGRQGRGLRRRGGRRRRHPRLRRIATESGLVLRRQRARLPTRLLRAAARPSSAGRPDLHDPQLQPDSGDRSLPADVGLP